MQNSPRKSGKPEERDEKGSPGLRRSRRGASLMISFVLLTLLGVSVGVGFLAWSKGFASSSVSDLERRSEHVTLCESAGVQVRSLCQNSQTLNMNVSNSNNVKIDELLVLLYDIYNEPQRRSINVTIKPSETRAVVLVKQGIAAQLELVPVLQSGKNRVICQSRRLEISDIPIC